MYITDWDYIVASVQQAPFLPTQLTDYCCPTDNEYTQYASHISMKKTIICRRHIDFNSLQSCK